MASRLVVGLFHSSGIAEDAVHRLMTEGVPARDIAHRVLKEVRPVPPTLQPEFEALSIDPLVLGDVRETFAQFIRDGETAVLVQAVTDQEVELAAGVLRLYAPIAVEVVPLPEGQSKPNS